MKIQVFWDVTLLLDEYSKSWFIWHWMIWKAVLTRSLQRPITLHGAIYLQNTAPIPKVQKAKADQERLFTG
jgi:hypothetical protein